MKKTILLKKLEEEKLNYILDKNCLTVVIKGMGIVGIDLESDYYLFHLFFKMLEKAKNPK